LADGFDPLAIDADEYIAFAQADVFGRGAPPNIQNDNAGKIIERQFFGKRW